MKISVILFFFLIIIPGYVLAQEKGNIMNGVQLRRQFEIKLSTGFSGSQVTAIDGPLTPYSITGKIFDFAFGYTLDVSEGFGVYTEGKLGMYPQIFGIPASPFTEGVSPKQYFTYAFYIPYAGLSAGITAKQPLGSRSVIRTSVGFGFKFLPQAAAGEFGFNANDGFFDCVVPPGPKAFIAITPSLQYKLKNHNLIGFSASYYYSLRDLYFGTYELARNSGGLSYGEFRVEGHELSVGVTYAFTGYKKLLKKAEKFQK
jgi:hypothetical protein